MIAARQVRQPGPVSPIRLESHLGAAKTLDFALEPGLCLNDAIARPLQRAGIAAAGVTLTGVGFRPFRYVIPAYAPDADHVAYYSQTYAPAGEVELEIATLTYGRRGDAAFLHCHALWRDPAGAPRGGHILPLDAIVASPGRATAFGTDQVAMLCEPDPETNFTLFRPAALLPPGADARCLVARIRPNEDLVASIEALCRHHRITRARIHSGIGSTAGMVFDDGRTIEERPTELLTLEGRVAPDALGQPVVDLDIAVIDVHGRIHRGTPAPGANPVLICFELILQSVDRHDQFR